MIADFTPPALPRMRPLGSVVKKSQLSAPKPLMSR